MSLPTKQSVYVVPTAVGASIVEASNVPLWLIGLAPLISVSPTSAVLVVLEAPARVEKQPHEVVPCRSETSSPSWKMVAVTSALSSRPMSTVLKRGIVATVEEAAAPLAASALMRTPVMRGVTAAMVVTENSSDQMLGPTESLTSDWAEVTPLAGSLMPMLAGTVTATSAPKASVLVDEVSCRMELAPLRVNDAVSKVSGADVTATPL
mmetsp:Transcript_28462/g.71622  ORF Transcript_28462/g.71622 Transcript_28462/m.71622 type:complete len:208 (+) Transcript_28462:1862-2485(+)